ncbi:hypothetical protein Cadr_000013955 [Camelus dromedarius]|uniref:Uncharacterized protein n=1 Tax=Camelus dromedarius TaxID=9838 RepID=A0A5N4DC27_CAMDR|nr:hypothetical protein Cadr_000013955 [Camelus dromedarius]
MQAYLPSKLAGVANYPAQCACLAALLSAEIPELVKAVTPPHYRPVCSISIGSKGQDGVVVSGGCLWDLHAESFATFHYSLAEKTQPLAHQSVTWEHSTHPDKASCFHDSQSMESK